MNAVKRSMYCFLLRQIRTYSSRQTGPKNHYNSLGITPKCTQGEIKNAYYELSKIYHPDKNQGNEEYAKKFRDISEAYEVLGNVQTRKLYDKGLHLGLSGFNSRTVSREDDDDTPFAKFHQSRASRSRPPTASGRTPIYDFDEWSKNHYGNLFRQRQENIRRSAAYKKTLEDDELKAKMDKIIMAMVVLFLISMIFTREDYDNVIFDKKPSE